MARYSSDSEDDRRSRERRSKSSRKRDRRSRSRSRGRRRRSRSRSRSSRSHRRRSRSRSFDRRSSDHESYRSKRSRSDRDRRSRSPSSSRNSEDGQRDRRERDDAVEKTKQKIKEALNQALNQVETKDDDLIKAKEKKKIGKEVIPSSDAIAEIESDAFVQQSFSSSSKDKQATVDDSQPGVLFGTTRVNAAVPVNFLTDSIEGKGLFAACVLEDESTKMERWIKKLTATRNKMLAAGSVKH